MANNTFLFAALLCNQKRQRACNRHAMPIGFYGEAGNTGFIVPPLFRTAHGDIVPISREGPPGLSS